MTISFHKWFLTDMLSKVAARAPHALPLAAQLFGVAPCETCGFVKEHCKCHDDSKGYN